MSLLTRVGPEWPVTYGDVKLRQASWDSCSTDGPDVAEPRPSALIDIWRLRIRFRCKLTGIFKIVNIRYYNQSRPKRAAKLNKIIYNQPIRILCISVFSTDPLHGIGIGYRADAGGNDDD